MKVKRETPTELVVTDTVAWISYACLVTAAVLFYAGVIVAQRLSGLVVVGLLLFFAAGFQMKTEVIFDNSTRQARWKRRRLFWATSGTIAFDEIRGIRMETNPGADDSPSYRLAILTSQGVVPMSDAYSGGAPQRQEHLKERILRFVGIDPSDEYRTSDESLIRLALAQGRKIDAIQLLRSFNHIGLTEAKRQVEAIEAQTKCKDAGDEDQAADESLIGSLLARGSRIDAIRLLRTSKRMSMAEAKRRVEAVATRTKTG